MQDTSGFYKIEINYYNNKEKKLLLYGPNGVSHADYSLMREFNEICDCDHHDENPELVICEHCCHPKQYPVYDWRWFNSEEEARTFFNVPLPPQDNASNGELL